MPAEVDQRRIPVGAALAVSRTTDGGRSLTALRNGLPQQHCYDLVYRRGLAVDANGRTLLMGSTTSGVWMPLDGGDDWETISTTIPSVNAVCFAECYAAALSNSRVSDFDFKYDDTLSIMQ